MVRKNDSSTVLKEDNSGQIIAMIMGFLQLFISKTLAKRILSLILIAAGVPNKRVTELTGLCDKSVRDLRKATETGDVDGLLNDARGRGKKSKLSDVEKEI